jgi:hypothetical protein
MPFSYSTDNQTQNGVQSIAGRGPMPYFHDQYDAQRSMWGRTPEAMYPDGYLGTISSRREDKLLDSVKNITGKRSYTRGVHKGERIDPSDYHWTPEWNPMVGLRSEAVGLRTALVDGGYVTPHLTKMGKMPQPIDQTIPLDPERIRSLQRLAPPWS